MQGIFYRLLIAFSRIFGTSIIDLVSRGIAAGFFLLLPGRTSVSVRFYRELIPERSMAFHVRCTWRQYQNFTSVFLDRIRLWHGEPIHHTCEGLEHLDAALELKTGGIFLMSHLGNWEMAAHLLKRQRPDLRFLLYMGTRAGEEIEKMQKADLQDAGIRIVAAESDGGSPFDILEGVRFLRDGGIVSMAADQIWRTDQRIVTVSFLGHQVRLPIAPYVLALLSGAPLFVFFSFRSEPRRYHFTLSPPIRLDAVSRSKRHAVIQKAAQEYAAFLEKALRENPFEWYHFRPFLGPNI